MNVRDALAAKRKAEKWPASVPSLTNDSQLAANHRVFGHEE